MRIDSIGMSSPSPRPSALGSNGSSSTSHSNKGAAPPTSFYNVIMTPVNFVTFLFSLILVDLRYTLMRSHTHSQTPSRLPQWLHALVYRSQPYENGRKKTGSGQWYYHTKQKKLLRMEAEEAFRFRNTMVLFLGLAAVCATAGIWYGITRMFNQWIPA